MRDKCECCVVISGHHTPPHCRDFVEQSSDTDKNTANPTEKVNSSLIYTHFLWLLLLVDIEVLSWNVCFLCTLGKVTSYPTI